MKPAEPEVKSEAKPAKHPLEMKPAEPEAKPAKHPLEMKKKKKSTKKKSKASKKKNNVSVKKVNAEVENALLAAVKKAREFLLAERLMLRLARKCSYEDVISGLGVSLKAMFKDSMLFPNPLAAAAAATAARSKAEAKAERKKKKLTIALKHDQNSVKNTCMKVPKLDSDNDS